MQNRIHDGAWVIFRDSKGKEWLRQVKAGKEFQTHKGVIFFDNLIGKPFGLIHPIQKENILILEPRASQFMKNTTHATNIIYEGDAVAMLSEAGVGPGDVVLEVGTGSGGLTYYLAFYCTKNSSGKVISIDLRKDHSIVAQQNLERIDLSKSVEFRVGIIDDILPEIKTFDAAFIDMATPWEILSKIKTAVKFGKSILIFLPNFYQVETTIQKAKELDLTVVGVFETLRRKLDVKPEKHIMRPQFRGIMYSGIIIHLVVSYSET